MSPQSPAQAPPERPFRVGEGRISAALSVALGGLSLLAVLCFRFPEWLTTPELRAALPMDLVRQLLLAAIALALGFGLLAALLSGRFRMGLAGIALAALAVLAGGAWVEVEGAVGASPHLGLDWFVLDLLVLALLFVPLERWLALRPAQRVFRRGWRTDLAHFAVNHLLVQLTVFLSMAPAGLLLAGAIDARFQQQVAAQPLWLQFGAVVLVADLFQYASHRLMHAVPWLWRFHAVHHSSEELDWLAGSRLHLGDILLTRAVTFLPLFALGFSERALAAYAVAVSFHAVWIHANLRPRLAWLRWLVATPAWHHWHHSAEAEARDVNFAVHLPLLDRLFGTAWFPERWPARYGVMGERVPDGYVAQLAYPFRRAGPVPEAEAETAAPPEAPRG